MTASGNLMTTGFGLLIVIVMCYTAGRIHQWYRHTTDREASFREGYNLATKSLFGLAVRTTAPSRGFAPGLALVAPPITVGSAVPGTAKARHRADDRLVGETLRLIVPGESPTRLSA